ncbi:transposable element Tc3 transposase [Trichonephila clavipes]|nr:transposable element Tc3 transposase [Trichonephila clavipes]
MNRLTPEQRFQIVQFYFESNGSVRNTYRALRPFYSRQNRPSEQLIRLSMERFRTTFNLMDNSHPQRRRTVRTEEAIATVERSIHDEAHFWLNSYVNKQNCRIWSEANPQVYVKTPIHPEKLTVWCSLWAGGILLQKR